MEHSQPSLDHVQNGLVFVEPHVVVGYRHGLKDDGLGVLEEGIGPPHVFQPVHF